MADYYTNFSLILTLPNAAARTYALALHQRLEEHRDDETRPDDVPESLWEFREDWCFDADTHGHMDFWLHSSSGGIEAACAFLQHLIQRFQLKEAVTFEWSHDCSKPRTDAYGGGAAFITADEIRMFSTAEWVRQQAEAPKARAHRFSLETQLCGQCGIHSDDAALAGSSCLP